MQYYSDLVVKDVLVQPSKHVKQLRFVRTVGKGTDWAGETIEQYGGASAFHSSFSSEV